MTRDPGRQLPDAILAGVDQADLTAADQLAIRRLIELYGHIVDEGDWYQLEHLVTDDFEYDLSFYGWGIVRGVPALIARWRAVEHPIAHHATNVVAWADALGVHAQSKGIGLKQDGGINSNVYYDELRLTEQGWRLARRRVVRRGE